MNVKMIRQNAGVTQKQFADKLGVSVATVQSWEQGLRPVTPPMQKLILMIDFSEGWEL